MYTGWEVGVTKRDTGKVTFKTNGVLLNNNNNKNPHKGHMVKHTAPPICEC